MPHLASQHNHGYARPRLRGIRAFLYGTRPVNASDVKDPKRVENSGGITASLQGRYASALFDLASESGKVSVVEGDLARLGQALSESGDLAALIRNPRLGRDAAGKTMAALAKLLKLSPLTGNFLGVLAGNGRLAKLPEAIRAFSSIAAASRGEVAAEVTSAHPLSDAQLKAIGAKLKAREGKEVKLTAKVDPDVLGGLIVRIGSTQIDSSIRTRLNTLANAMKG